MLQQHTYSRKEKYLRAHCTAATGSEIDAQDSKGETPLMFAAFFGHLGDVKFLLKTGADPEIRNSEQESPVDVVCKCKDKGCTYDEACDAPTQEDIIEMLESARQ